jgi:hypothetical protein
MKNKTILWTFFLLLTLILSACVPFTFSQPTEIHLDPGDQMEEAAVAVDGNGRSHIAGVVNDRIVYYRTRYGEPLAKFAMVMSGSGADWKQYSPDIAALNNGTAYIVWVEQRGGPEKFACWRSVPLVPVVSWGESDLVTATYYSAGWLTPPVKVSEDQCPESLLLGDVGSNGVYMSGMLVRTPGSPPRPGTHSYR